MTETWLLVRTSTTGGGTAAAPVMDGQTGRALTFSSREHAEWYAAESSIAAVAVPTVKADARFYRRATSGAS